MATITLASGAAAIARSRQAHADVLSGPKPQDYVTDFLWPVSGSQVIVRGAVFDQVGLTNTQYAALLTGDELTSVNTGKPTTVMAHQGFSNEGPQNTLLAFRRAIQQGADILEGDVQPSSNGDLRMFHDTDLSPVSTGAGVFKEQASSYIDTLTVGGQPIARLSEIVALVTAANIPFWPEIKSKRSDADIDAMVAATVSIESLVTWQSFTLSDLQRVRSLNANMGVALAYQGEGTPEASIDTLAGLGNAHLFVWDQRLTTEMADYCTNAGVGVAAWTVNTKSGIATAVSKGVGVICTDYSWWRMPT